MNIHNRELWEKSHIPRFGCAAFVFGVISGSLIAGIPESDHVPIAAPSLQKVVLWDTNSYAFEFATSRGAALPALIEAGANSQGERTLEKYYLFGMTHGRPHIPPVQPLRWDTKEHTLFAAREFPASFGPPTPRIFRYPIRALVQRSEWSDCLERGELGDEIPSPKSWPAPHYVDLDPIRAALLKGMVVRNDLSAPKGSAIHYDIRALDATRIELYMTVNGKLSLWLFDGETWTLRHNYSISVDGPFLICDDGKSIVTKRKDDWCLLGELNAKQPKVQRIVKSSPDEPLTLVEDKMTGINYFEYGGALYDANGVDVCPIPRDADAATRLKVITEFVRSRRSR